jgi:hypothetical protein
VARTKIKRKRHYDSCRNHMKPISNFLETRGVGSKRYLANDDNFDTEDEKWRNIEHGLSKKSYKANSYNDYLNNYEERLNKGKKRNNKKRRRSIRSIRHREGGLSSHELQRIMEEYR